MAEIVDNDNQQAEQDGDGSYTGNAEHQAVRMGMLQNAVIEFARRRIGKERPYRSYAAEILLK